MPSKGRPHECYSGCIPASLIFLPHAASCSLTKRSSSAGLPGTYLERLIFKLMAVMGSGTNWIPGRAGTALVLLDAGNVPEYFTAIGLNTRYIIHPEEILADNFILLVRGERKVRTPRILEELERVLAGK